MTKQVKTDTRDLPPISQDIWEMKYRLRALSGDALDETLDDSFRRVAKALAAAEEKPDDWESPFFEAMRDLRFLPAGRILAGAGSDRDVTLFNCFVMGQIPDSMDGIFSQLREAALTLQMGGGIGYDFSTLRPRGAAVMGVGADASGPLSFMDVWDSMCRTIMSAGYRRGAMMGTLRCDHPDIEDFIAAKQDPGRLRMFNLSVLVTDAFMQALREDKDWDLTFNGKVTRSLRARDLWDRMMRATYDYAEPGVIFIDRINQQNNLAYAEEIFATNPCGEQPLPPYGACLLGSVNLARMIDNPFKKTATLNIEALKNTIGTAVRMLDNAIDASRFPLPAQRDEAMAKRRIGLGITGLADALIFCGQRYGSREAVATVEQWMRAFRDAAYETSIELAREKGAFPLFEKEPYLNSPQVKDLPETLRQAIGEHGIRNGLVTSVAPTGTISLLAGNVSSGLEPVYAFSYRRNILLPDGSSRQEIVEDHAMRRFRKMFGDTAEVPESFVDAQHLEPGAHLVMQATVQRFIDSSVSKTINLPEQISFDGFKDVYLRAYEMGCKGCTTYRPNPTTGAVLEPMAAVEQGDPAPAAGSIEADGQVVYMSQPLDRPQALPGRTYKLQWPESDHAIYITLNDIVQDQRRRPFEIFINSKNMEHYAWTVALTRMISAVFRRGGDVSFVVEELKAVFDPRGGAWVKGRYLPSLLAAIGEVIERHMLDIGFLARPETLVEPQQETAREGAKSDPPYSISSHSNHQPGQRGPAQCPRCGAAAVIKQEGCDLCTACGHSRCF
ncbi:adenosylcobalamin-dependent ribonucleoside-diphosphate reductase [Limibacillus halophilus]|uniref:Vitamin B12-dependent ribonucleotide reductase n=1 Tax=Limibacillus halophilus TaxID=1579333 RepID=A0A839STF7_9PROT|nr:adenosylcobalamin-dependent ribonucleoside-diphosphate reductase [Limibacillus halophilus]MBB3066081.1 ribonucleoside-diphosphate reductase alpha chain [Limibacillus halophilus]